MISIKDQINELRVKKGEFATSLTKAEEAAHTVLSHTPSISAFDKNFLRDLQFAFERDEEETKSIGRPRKDASEASRKFTVRLVSKLNEYFLKLKDWKGQDLGKDSKRVAFLIREHQVWERVVRNYCSSMRRYIAHIEKELVSTDIGPETISKMNDVFLLFGLYQIPLEDHIRYFSDKELRIIRLCVTYSNNRKN